MSKFEKRQLELQTLTSRDLDGVEMGVLEDGTSFLTGRGLAAICGVAPSVINQWANEYNPNSGKKRDDAISRFLGAYRFNGESLFVKTKISGQGEVNAYPEAVKRCGLVDGQGSLKWFCGRPEHEASMPLGRQQADSTSSFYGEHRVLAEHFRS